VRGVEITCISADAWEDNDVREAAPDVSKNWSANGATPAFIEAATLLPASDVDWYKLPNTKLNIQYRAGEKLEVGSGSSPIFIDVYRDGDVVATGVKTYKLTADDLAAPHDWEIRVHGAVAASYYLIVNSESYSPDQ
jgi:hypothetical protein